jgi:RNase adapter protein RapZ
MLGVSVQSFSYKRGLPRGIDMMFDCRFLRNPIGNPRCATAGRPRDPEVKAHIAADPGSRPSSRR